MVVLKLIKKVREYVVTFLIGFAVIAAGQWLGDAWPDIFGGWVVFGFAFVGVLIIAYGVGRLFSVRYWLGELGVLPKIKDKK